VGGRRPLAGGVDGGAARRKVIRCIPSQSQTANAHNETCWLTSRFPTWRK